MKGTKLAALVLSAFLACSVTGVHAFANVPASAEADSTETEVTASRLGEDINAGSSVPDQVIGADGKPLTPEGNLSLVDDIITESGKQFITLTSRDGNYYYLIIDRSGNEDDNVYFLNKVDERDLLTLMDEEDVEEIEQARQEEAERLAEEAAKKEAAKKAREEAAARAEQEKAEHAPRTYRIGGLELNGFQLFIPLGIIVLLLSAGAVIFLRRKKAANAVKADPDMGLDFIDDEMPDMGDGQDMQTDTPDASGLESMVAGQQDLRHPAAPPLLGAGVLGILQQPLPVALVGEAHLLGQHPRHHAADAVRYGHGRNLAPGDHKVPQGDLLVHALLDEALVQALVVAAHQNDVLPPQQLPGHALVKGAALGGHEHRVHVPACLLTQGPVAEIQRLRQHDQPLAAAVGIVVRAAVVGGGVVPDVGGPDGDEALGLGLADDAGLHHCADHIRKQGHNVDGHAALTHRPSSLLWSPP